jgi:hypothetical protein
MIWRGDVEAVVDPSNAQVRPPSLQLGPAQTFVTQVPLEQSPSVRHAAES